MFVKHSANPTLHAFEKPARWSDLADTVPGEKAAPATMTLRGTVIASAVLVGIAGMGAVLSWEAMTTGLFGVTIPVFGGLMIGFLGGLVLGLIISFVPKTAPFLAPVYAALEGLVLAGISLVVAERWLGGAQNPEAMGTIFQAIFLTFAIALGMLIAYATGLIKGGKIFNAVVLTGTMGLVLYVAVLWIGNGIFGAGIPNLYASASPIGIGFTAVCLVLASLMLVLDFQLIESGVKNGAPKHMEWYGGFALLMTLVWIYIEVLRLLAKLRSSE